MPKTKEKLSKINKIKWLIGFGERMSKKLKINATPPELKLKFILDQLNFKFIFQEPIIVRGKYLYIMDFYFPDLDLSIEVQSIKYHSTKEQIKHDNIKKRRIKSEGVDTIYIWAKQTSYLTKEDLKQLLSSVKK